MILIFITTIIVAQLHCKENQGNKMDDFIHLIDRIPRANPATGAYSNQPHKKFKRTHIWHQTIIEGQLAEKMSADPTLESSEAHSCFTLDEKMETAVLFSGIWLNFTPRKVSLTTLSLCKSY